MAKRRIEQELGELAAWRAGGATEQAEAALAQALKDKVNLIVAKAASVASDLQLVSLMPQMRNSYERFFQNPVKTDPQCWGKTALVKALKTLGCAEAAPFLRGAGYVQMEPVWGGEADSAIELRGTCALALVQCTDIPARQILSRLVDAAADTAGPVRQDAVQGLAQWGSVEAILLLRLKARLGDPEPAVTGGIFDALLRLEGEEAVEFVASFLHVAEESVQDEAALALGACKLEAAIGLLRERWQKRRPTQPFEVLIRAFGASRLPSAMECLLAIVRSGRQKEAEMALSALQAWSKSAEAWMKISEAVASRADDALQAAFETEFERPEEA